MKLSNIINATLLIASAVGLTGCSKSDNSHHEQPLTAKESAAEKYIVSKNGIVTETDRHEYQSLGDVTFYRTQNYKVQLLEDQNEGRNRILYVKIIIRVGGKDKSSYQEPIVIQNGEGELSCGYRYDLKIAKADEAADPECKITLLGDTTLNNVSVEFK